MDNSSPTQHESLRGLLSVGEIRSFDVDSLDISQGHQEMLAVGFLAIVALPELLQEGHHKGLRRVGGLADVSREVLKIDVVFLLKNSSFKLGSGSNHLETYANQLHIRSGISGTSPSGDRSVSDGVPQKASIRRDLVAQIFIGEGPVVNFRPAEGGVDQLPTILVESDAVAERVFFGNVRQAEVAG